MIVAVKKIKIEARVVKSNGGEGRSQLKIVYIGMLLEENRRKKQL